MKKVVFDFTVLKKRIRAMFSTQDLFAKEIGISGAQVSRLLNGKIKFTTKMIISFCNALKIDAEDISAYFFCETT